jgi:hypothetical protein
MSIERGGIGRLVGLALKLKTGQGIPDGVEQLSQLLGNN